ncbi:MAG TPA: hypothetical protein VMF31_10595 [Solirubrobacterales bacterium]|nr:hypothetical protein [Solirubrobacterales bacterium]
MSSSVPKVALHVEQLFIDALTGEDVKVFFGYGEASEMVTISMGSDFSREFKLLGPSPVPLEEKFNIEISVEVWKASGKDLKPAYVRCWDIFDLIEDAARGDHELDDMSFDALLSKGDQEFFTVDKAQICRIRSTLAGTARI